MTSSVAWPLATPSLGTLQAHVAAGTRVADVSGPALRAQRDTLLQWLGEDPARLATLRTVAPALPKDLTFFVSMSVLNIEGDAPEPLVREALSDSHIEWTAHVARDFMATKEVVEKQLATHDIQMPNLTPVGPAFAAVMARLSARAPRAGVPVTVDLGAWMQQTILPLLQVQLKKSATTDVSSAAFLSTVATGNLAAVDEKARAIREMDAALFPARVLSLEAAEQADTAHRLVGSALAAGPKPKTQRRVLDRFSRAASRLHEQAIRTTLSAEAPAVDPAAIQAHIDTMTAKLAAAARDARRSVGDRQPKRPRKAKRLL